MFFLSGVAAVKGVTDALAFVALFYAAHAVRADYDGPTVVSRRARVYGGRVTLTLAFAGAVALSAGWATTAMAGGAAGRHRLPSRPYLPSPRGPRPWTAA